MKSLLHFVSVISVIVVTMIVSATIAEGDTQTIETTDAHPFWVVTDNPDLSRAAGDFVVENGTILYHENLAVTEHGYYVEAKDLKVGDVFIGANGELTTLTDTYREEFPNGVTVYNFTVADNHNYYVIGSFEAYQNGASVVLVHNADYHPSIKGNPYSGKDAPAQAFKHLEEHHGVAEHVASNRLHEIKEAGGLKAADDVIIGRTGDVYDAMTGTSLGSLTDPSIGGFKR